MTENEKLEYLMKSAKKTKADAEYFINLLADDDENQQYWQGRKFGAEMNIKLLQSFGISAKDGS